MDSSLMLSFVSAAVAVGSLVYNIRLGRSRDHADRQRRIREEAQAAQKLRATVDLVDGFNDKLELGYDGLFSRAGTAGSGYHRACKEQVRERRDELASIREFVEYALAQNPQNLSDHVSKITDRQEAWTL